MGIEPIPPDAYGRYGWVGSHGWVSYQGPSDVPLSGYRPTSGGDNSNPPGAAVQPQDPGGKRLITMPRNPGTWVWNGEERPPVEWFRVMFHPLPMLLAGLLGWLLWA